MSLLNGLSDFGSGVSKLATAGINDKVWQVERASLLNGAPPAMAKPAAVAAPAPEPAADAPRAAGAVKVPADLLPLYQAASKRTGIPIDVLIAQAKQESGFDPNVVSSTGGIGLHQIQPSTARDPGYGLAPVDPATLKDPAVNIAFAAAYLKARGGDIDWNDPKAVDAALKSYNGGGDSRYVENVRRYMKVG